MSMVERGQAGTGEEKSLDEKLRGKLVPFYLFCNDCKSAEPVAYTLGKYKGYDKIPNDVRTNLRDAAISQHQSRFPDHTLYSVCVFWPGFVNPELIIQLSPRIRLGPPKRAGRK